MTVVELALKAANYPIWKELSVFIGLIITNCIVMGRLEAYAMANKPWKSFLDGIGNGAGYALILIIVASVRELLVKVLCWILKLSGLHQNMLSILLTFHFSVGILPII